MEIREVQKEDFPPLLKEIQDPPKKLHIIGDVPKCQFYLSVVGSRRPSPYGAHAVENLISGLSGYSICIVSGLALGIDALAHKSALEAGLKTIAVPGSGLSPNVLYPSRNRELARKIVESGGALISEFENDFKATLWSFPQRNRVMAGLSHAVLLVEAEEKSGTLITAKLASDYNRDVLVVPGSIYSSHSKGTNLFLRLGAEAITKSEDILSHFSLIDPSVARDKIDIEKEMSDDEKIIWKKLTDPKTRESLVSQSGLPAERASVALSLLEIKNFIKEKMGKVYKNI